MVPANSNRASPTPSYSGYPPRTFLYPYAALTLYGRPSQTFQVLSGAIMQVLLPQLGRNPAGLGCSAFARHYLRNHYCFLLLCLLRCFSSAGLPSPLTGRNNTPSAYWVAPFGYPRINSYVPIPAAFRSLSRPSSPLRA